MSDYLRFIGAGIDETKSFLSECVDKKVSRLADCYDWFKTTLNIVKADSTYGGLHSEASSNRNFLKFLSEKIGASDTGVNSLALRKMKASSSDLSSELMANVPDLYRQMINLSEEDSLIIGGPDGQMGVITKSGDELTLQKMVATHLASDGTEVEFDMTEESSGTRRLIDLYPMLFKLVEADRVYVVDELDRKLHPLLAFDLVRSFLSQSKGQLIFTTHTSYLMDLELLRKDEVWLVEKTRGSSQIFSLSEFKIRKDLDIRKGYLQGRFGGIPNVFSHELS